jgi:transcription antitermination factor NusG
VSTEFQGKRLQSKYEREVKENLRKRVAEHEYEKQMQKLEEEKEKVSLLSFLKDQSTFGELILEFDKSYCS